MQILAEAKMGLKTVECKLYVIYIVVILTHNSNHAAVKT